MRPPAVACVSWVAGRHSGWSQTLRLWQCRQRRSSLRMRLSRWWLTRNQQRPPVGMTPTQRTAWRMRQTCTRCDRLCMDPSGWMHHASGCQKKRRSTVSGASGCQKKAQKHCVRSTGLACADWVLGPLASPPSRACSTHTFTACAWCPACAQAVKLLDFVARGTRRSRLWLVKLVGQVTSDKAVADAVADRQGLARSSMRDFVPAWGLTR